MNLIATKKERLLKKLALADALNLLETTNANFPRYIVNSLDKFEDTDWDVIKSVYKRAMVNGDIVKQ